MDIFEPGVSKVQPIRLADVFVIGPLMIWGARNPNLPPAARAALAFFGVGTIVFNGINWIRVERGEIHP